MDHRPAEERHAAKRLDNNIPPMRSVIAPLRARAHLEGLGRGRGGEGDEHDHALHLLFHRQCKIAVGDLETLPGFCLPPLDDLGAQGLKSLQRWEGEPQQGQNSLP